MSSFNRATILGRLGADAEVIRTGPNTIARMSIATSQFWKDDTGATREKVTWHKVKVWGKLAEACGVQALKGHLVFVDGAIESRSFDDKDGNRRTQVEIKAQCVRFLGRRQAEIESTGGGGGGSPRPEVRTGSVPDMREPVLNVPGDDDVPF